MKTNDDSVTTRPLLVVVGVWAVGVSASVVATWGVSEWFGLDFDPAIVVVLSSVAVATALVRHGRKNDS